MDLSSLFDDSFGVAATVEDFDADFGLSFGFGASFDAGFGNFDGSVIVQFDDFSLGTSGKPLLGLWPFFGTFDFVA
jgi:hypothetical protein